MDWENDAMPAKAVPGNYCLGHGVGWWGWKMIQCLQRQYQENYCFGHGLNSIDLELEDPESVADALQYGAIFKSKTSGLEYATGVIYQGPQIGFRRPRMGIKLYEGEEGYALAHPSDKAQGGSTRKKKQATAENSYPICAISL